MKNQVEILIFYLYINFDFFAIITNIMAQIKQPEYLPSIQLEITKENLSENQILEAEILDVVEDFEKYVK